MSRYDTSIIIFRNLNNKKKKNSQRDDTNATFVWSVLPDATRLVTTLSWKIRWGQLANYTLTGSATCRHLIQIHTCMASHRQSHVTLPRAINNNNITFKVFSQEGTRYIYTDLGYVVRDIVRFSLLTQQVACAGRCTLVTGWHRRLYDLSRVYLFIFVWYLILI